MYSFLGQVWRLFHVTWSDYLTSVQDSIWRSLCPYGCHHVDEHWTSWTYTTSFWQMHHRETYSRIYHTECSTLVVQFTVVVVPFARIFHPPDEYETSSVCDEYQTVVTPVLECMADTWRKLLANRRLFDLLLFAGVVVHGRWSRVYYETKRHARGDPSGEDVYFFFQTIQTTVGVRF